MPSRATYRQWVNMVEQTNKCAAKYLAGEVSKEVLDNFFDQESEVFQSWGGPPQDRDWKDDRNR